MIHPIAQAVPRRFVRRGLTLGAGAGLLLSLGIGLALGPLGGRVQAGAPRPEAPAPATPIPCQDAYEGDGVPARARPLVIGEHQAHSFCPAGDADWLTFFANKGKGYEIATTQLSPGVDTYLYVLAPDGKTVLGYNDDAPGAHGPSQLDFVPPADGWYFVLAKNQGDIGFPGATYTISLRLTDGPTATATATQAPPAPPSATATSAPPPTALSPATSTPAAWTALPHPTAGNPPPFSAPGSPTALPTPDGLLLPLAGGAGSGGLPVFDAGPADGMSADRLEPNDSFAQAAPVNVGAVYAHLNFVPAQAGRPDADFYVFRAKPGNCYLVQTGDLSPGLDTTILLWQAAATREGRRLLAQNDDMHPHTADLSSAVRWCGGPDALLVAEVHNYGQAPLTDPHGKTYSLAVQIDPPTPVPSATPRPAPVVPATGGGGVPPAPVPVRIPPPAAPPANPPLPTVPPPATRPPSPIPPVPSATIPASATALPTGTRIPTPTPTPPAISVDVIAFVGEPNAPGPLQGDGIVGWPVQLVDQRTNAVLQTVTTDPNGHATLTWLWTAPVWIEMPILRWSTLVRDPRDPALGAPIYARKESYPLPGIWP